LSIKHFLKEEKFYHYFQPIYSLKSGEKLGYEVLLRSNIYPNPDYTFQEARKEKQLYELDSQSIHKAIATYHSAGLSKKDGKLFLNIFPSTILNPSFPSFLNKIITNNYLDSQEIILEISESELIEEFDTFKERIAELKKIGFLIAIDDIGQGYTNLKIIIELEPDYLKFDRYFTQNLQLSKQKQAIITLFLSYCDQYKSQLILEGVENEEDITIAKELGIPIAQGYFLGRPALLNDKPSLQA
jgi:EAL domain-containing protein (putative c-di-GMP-specific phosphodiesterase class I)